MTTKITNEKCLFVTIVLKKGGRTLHTTPKQKKERKKERKKEKERERLKETISQESMAGMWQWLAMEVFLNGPTPVEDNEQTPCWKPIFPHNVKESHFLLFVWSCFVFKSTELPCCCMVLSNHFCGGLGFMCFHQEDDSRADSTTQSMHLWILKIISQWPTACSATTGKSIDNVRSQETHHNWCWVCRKSIACPHRWNGLPLLWHKKMSFGQVNQSTVTTFNTGVLWFNPLALQRNAFFLLGRCCTQSVVLVPRATVTESDKCHPSTQVVLSCIQSHGESTQNFILFCVLVVKNQKVVMPQQGMLLIELGRKWMDDKWTDNWHCLAWGEPRKQGLLLSPSHAESEVWRSFGSVHWKDKRMKALVPKCWGGWGTEGFQRWQWTVVKKGQLLGLGTCVKILGTGNVHMN